MLEVIANNKISLGICLTLFGFLAVHRLALYRQKESARAVAANKLVSVFTSELSSIYPVCSKWPENIDSFLKNKFPILQSAIESYKPFVKNKKGFIKAWDLYRLGKDGRIIDKQVYHQYMGFQINDEPVVDPEKCIIENIDRILAYAKT